MTNVPFYDIVFYFAVVPGLWLVLIVVVFRELHRLRHAIAETNGLYRIMLDYVLETSAPDKSEDDGGDSPL
jgi:hypothetical protein